MRGYDDWKTTEPDYLDPGHWRTDEDRDTHLDYRPICDDCGTTINLGLVSLAGVGIFCSHACANRGAAKHEAAMQPRVPK